MNLNSKILSLLKESDEENFFKPRRVNKRIENEKKLIEKKIQEIGLEKFENIYGFIIDSSLALDICRLIRANNIREVKKIAKDFTYKPIKEVFKLSDNDKILQYFVSNLEKQDYDFLNGIKDYDMFYLIGDL